MSYEQFVLSMPVFLSIGILAELCGIIGLGRVVLAILLYSPVLLFFSQDERYRTAMRMLFFAGTCVFLGGLAARYRIHAKQHEQIQKAVYMQQLSGEVIGFRRFGPKVQITIKTLDIKNGLIVRLSGRHKDDVAVGDVILLHSVQLKPIPMPAAIGAYDFAKEAYFQQIGATGFFFRPISILSHKPNINDYVVKVRKRVVRYVQYHLGDQNAAMLIAIIIGDKSFLNEDTASAIRKAGLAHMLAISGFHLSTMMNIVFSFIQICILLLTFRNPTAMVYQGRIAAICSAILGLLYLVIIDMPISAKRAYLMLLSFLIAIITGRLSTSLYGIAVSASILLLLSPEFLLSPSFQMSFMATLSIIAIHKRHGFYDIMQTPYSRGLLGDALRSIKMTALCSLAATFATMPFTLYYFNNFATLGIIANIIVAPIVTMIIAPLFLGSLAVSTMPFGSWFAKYLMSMIDYAMEFVRKTAIFIANVDFSTIGVRQISMATMLVLSAGMVLLCTRRLRLMGVPCILLGVIMVVASEPADMFIGLNNGNLMIAVNKNGVLETGSGRQSFMLREWAAQLGHADIKKVVIGNSVRLRGHDVRILRDGYRVQLTLGDAEHELDLEHCGTHQVWVKYETLVIKSVGQLRGSWLSRSTSQVQEQ